MPRPELQGELIYPERIDMSGAPAVDQLLAFPNELLDTIVDMVGSQGRMSLRASCNKLRLYFRRRRWRTVHIGNNQARVLVILQTFNSSALAQPAAGDEVVSVADARNKIDEFYLVLQASGLLDYRDQWMVVERAYPFTDNSAKHELPSHIVKAISLMPRLKRLTLDLASITPDQAQGLHHYMELASEQWSSILYLKVVSIGSPDFLRTLVRKCCNVVALHTDTTSKPALEFTTDRQQSRITRLAMTSNFLDIVTQVPDFRVRDILKKYPNLERLIINDTFGGAYEMATEQDLRDIFSGLTGWFACHNRELRAVALHFTLIQSAGGRVEELRGKLLEPYAAFLLLRQPKLLTITTKQQYPSLLHVTGDRVHGESVTITTKLEELQANTHPEQWPLGLDPRSLR